MTLLQNDDMQEEHTGPSRRGLWTLGILFTLMVVPIIYFQFFATRPVRVAEAKTPPLNMGYQQPFRMPEEAPPPPPPVAQQPQPVPPAQRSPAPKRQETEAEKMRKKVRLAAHYAGPSALNVTLAGQGKGHSSDMDAM